MKKTGHEWFPSAAAGQLLAASGRCQVPEHYSQRGRQHRVQDQRQQHPRRQ